MLVHLFRRRQFSFAEDFREPFAHSVIVHRPDIGPSQIEEQKHFRGPAPDSAHLNQTLDNLVVGHFARAWPVGTVPSIVLAARSFKAATLLRDKPAARNFSSGVSSTSFGARNFRFGKMARTRFQIVAAAFPLSCW